MPLFDTWSAANHELQQYDFIPEVLSDAESNPSTQSTSSEAASGSIQSGISIPCAQRTNRRLHKRTVMQLSPSAAMMVTNDAASVDSSVETSLPCGQKRQKSCKKSHSGNIITGNYQSSLTSDSIQCGQRRTISNQSSERKSTSPVTGPSHICHISPSTSTIEPNSLSFPQISLDTVNEGHLLKGSHVTDLSKRKMKKMKKSGNKNPAVKKHHAQSCPEGYKLAQTSPASSTTTQRTNPKNIYGKEAFLWTSSDSDFM